MRGHLGEKAGREDGGEGDEGVVAKMEQIAGEDGAGVGADEGEDDADGGEDTDECPGPAELGSVEEAEEQAGGDDADTRAGLDGGSGIGAEAAGESSATGSEKRIQVAAEHGFFDEWCNQDGHAHEKECAGAILEEILNRKMFWRLDFGADDGDADGQAGAAGKVSPRAGGPIGVEAEFFPAERGPKRTAL